MNVFRTLTEAPPTLRWYVGRVLSASLYARAFAGFGTGTTIVAPLKLKGTERIRIGSDCAVYERCWLEAEPGARLTIGDGVYLGHDVHVHAVDDVEIGAGSMLADGVLVNSGGHDAANAMATTRQGAIHIGRSVFVGQRAIVLGGVTIGDGAVIGAGAVVTRDVDAGATVAGVPARPLPSHTPSERA